KLHLLNGDLDDVEHVDRRGLTHGFKDDPEHLVQVATSRFWKSHAEPLQNVRDANGQILTFGVNRVSRPSLPRPNRTEIVLTEGARDYLVRHGRTDIGAENLDELRPD